MRFLSRKCCLAILIATLVPIGASAKQMAVVVDKSNPTADLSASELGKILKFDSHKWPDGKDVTVVLLGPSSPEMQQVYQKLCKVQSTEMKTLLTSHPKSIVVVRSEEELLKAVANIPGAVGLIDVYSITNRVNVMKVDGKLPLEPGYILRGN